MTELSGICQDHAIVNEMKNAVAETAKLSKFIAYGAFTLDAKLRLATFASGRLRHLLKIGQPFKNNFGLSEGKKPLAKFATG